MIERSHAIFITHKQNGMKSQLLIIKITNIFFTLTKAALWNILLLAARLRLTKANHNSSVLPDLCVKQITTSSLPGRKKSLSIFRKALQKRFMRSLDHIHSFKNFNLLIILFATFLPCQNPVSIDCR